MSQTTQSSRPGSQGGRPGRQGGRPGREGGRPGRRPRPSRGARRRAPPSRPPAGSRSYGAHPDRTCGAATGPAAESARTLATPTTSRVHTASAEELHGGCGRYRCRGRAPAGRR